MNECSRCFGLGVVAYAGNDLKLYCHCEAGVAHSSEALKQTQKLLMPAIESAGRKDDGGKPRFELLRFGLSRALKGVVHVLTFGAKKYADHSWQRVPDGLNRYYGALDRHLAAIGEEGTQARDPETGLLHIEHVACNALFLVELTHREAEQTIADRPARRDSVRQSDGERS